MREFYAALGVVLMGFFDNFLRSYRILIILAPSESCDSQLSNGAKDRYEGRYRLSKNPIRTTKNTMQTIPHGNWDYKLSVGAEIIKIPMRSKEVTKDSNQDDAECNVQTPHGRQPFSNTVSSPGVCM